MRWYVLGLGRRRPCRREEVLIVRRVSLGFEYALRTLRAANAHGKPPSAHEDIHVILRGKEAVRVRSQGNRSERARCSLYLGPMIGYHTRSPS